MGRRKAKDTTKPLCKATEKEGHKNRGKMMSPQTTSHQDLRNDGTLESSPQQLSSASSSSDWPHQGSTSPPKPRMENAEGQGSRVLAPVLPCVVLHLREERCDSGISQHSSTHGSTSKKCATGPGLNNKTTAAESATGMGSFCGCGLSRMQRSENNTTQRNGGSRVKSLSGKT